MQKPNNNAKLIEKKGEIIMPKHPGSKHARAKIKTMKKMAFLPPKGNRPKSVNKVIRRTLTRKS